MTSTTILSSVSAGTGSNKGDLFNPVKTTLQAATTAVKVSARVTFGDGAAVPNKEIHIRHAVSPTSYSSALIGANALKQGADGVEIPTNPSGGLDLEKASDVLVTAAGYHYCWVEMPVLSTACTITVVLQELP